MDNNATIEKVYVLEAQVTALSELLAVEEKVVAEQSTKLAEAINALNEANEKLEIRVQQRTAELVRANQELQNEIAERKRAEEDLRKARDELEIQVVIRTRELRVANEELSRISFVDGLTGVSNRRFFDEFLEREWRRAKREGKSLALIMADIDFFKSYNDAYGHQAGDYCLKAIASTLKATTKRATDLVARYGGEEFAIVLPNTDARGANAVAEKMRNNVEALSIEHKESPINSYVTISLGTVSIIPGENTELTALINAADQALYQAKHEGRNRSVKYDDIL